MASTTASSARPATAFGRSAEAAIASTSSVLFTLKPSICSLKMVAARNVIGPENSSKHSRDHAEMGGWTCLLQGATNARGGDSTPVAALRVKVSAAIGKLIDQCAARGWSDLSPEFSTAT